MGGEVCKQVGSVRGSPLGGFGHPGVGRRGGDILEALGRPCGPTLCHREPHRRLADALHKPNSLFLNATRGWFIRATMQAGCCSAGATACQEAEGWTGPSKPMSMRCGKSHGWSTPSTAPRGKVSPQTSCIGYCGASRSPARPFYDAGRRPKRSDLVLDLGFALAEPQQKMHTSSAAEPRMTQRSRVRGRRGRGGKREAAN